MTPRDVLDYWLGPPITDLSGVMERALFWTSGDALDAPIRERFGDAIREAINGELDEWAETRDGRVALILLLDQFTRHIYRGTLQQFDGDAGALALALQMLEAGEFLEMRTEMCAWALMPLAHHEDVATVHQLVALHESVAARAPDFWAPVMAIGTSQSRKGLHVITRFGRFPHRNVLLGRESTPEELEFLAAQSHGPNPKKAELLN